jgi:hypothetical protein
MSYYGPDLKRIDLWAPQKTEVDNFYYELTNRNRADLAALASIVIGCEIAEIEGYLSELAGDLELRAHILRILSADPQLSDVRVGFGRREGWYALIRAMKPRVVVETGVHHGVGACVISAALRRNSEEGFPGRYVGTDIDPEAGRLLVDDYAASGTVIYGDSLDSLSRMEGPIDVFVNDSDHSASYERLEYECVASILSATSLILGDNSHVTSELREFSRISGRPFVFFKEEPDGHWYPGAGIGISASAVPIRNGGTGG